MHLARLESNGQPLLCLMRQDQYLPVTAVDAAAPEDLADFLAWLADWNDFCAQAPANGWKTMGAAERWLPPVSPRSRIFCVGKNYADHAKEMGMASGGPVAPDIFVRFPSSFTGHEGTIEYPAGESSFDFEGELAVFIGRAGSQIGDSDAVGHIFGYAAANDGSLRRIQKRTSQFTLGKNIDRSGAIGPTIVPAADAGDAQALRLQTLVDGTLMQDGNTADMTFPISQVIAVISSVTALQPGDIILTGTPAGVGAGRTPPRFLQDGETVEVRIEGFAPLSMLVRQRDAGVL